MKERIREIITNPIIVILLIAFAVSGVIIYGISSNMAEQKSEIVNSHMSSPLHLFHIHKEGLKLRRLRVRITNEWR